MPGSGLPTAPARGSPGGVNASTACDSVMPKASAISMPKPSQVASRSLVIGAAPVRPTHGAVEADRVAQLAVDDLLEEPVLEP